MNINVNRVKIIVTVPKDYTDKVKESMWNAGAGTISDSNYICCSTSVESIGTFKPCEGSKPFIGTTDKLETVIEDKLEVICEIDKVKNVINELRNVHPYEEPAIDIVPLLDENSFN